MREAAAEKERRDEEAAKRREEVMESLCLLGDYWFEMVNKPVPDASLADTVKSRTTASRGGMR